MAKKSRRGGGMRRLSSDRLKELTEQRTAMVLEHLKRGTAPWVRPWTADATPMNVVRNYRYKGSNIVWLRIWADIMQYPTGRWLTMNQANKLGGKLRKGEKQTMIVNWRPMTSKKDDEDAKGDEKVRVRNFMLPFYHYVVNVAQCDGLPEALVNPHVGEVPFDPNERAEVFLDALNINTRHGDESAYYTPALDQVSMPNREDFKSPADYYATRLHECTHATGHASRCNRDLTGRFGDENYAFEELIAELGASIAGTVVGLDGQLQHAEYIASWIKRLEDDPSELWRASTQAEKAVGWMVDQQAEDFVSAIELTDPPVAELDEPQDKAA